LNKEVTVRFGKLKNVAVGFDVLTTSTQYRLVQSGKTASGGCSAGQGSSEPVAPRTDYDDNPRCNLHSFILICHTQLLQVCKFLNISYEPVCTTCAYESNSTVTGTVMITPTGCVDDKIQA
jgi:hypothetical protein